MKELTVLLGAGFSFNAGLPLGSTVSAAFNRDVREKLLHFTSSEWAWVDGKREVDLNNGRLSYSWLGYSYILNEAKRLYESEKTFLNYEDFYQFLLDKNSDEEWCRNCIMGAKENLLKDKEYLREGLEEDNYYSSYLEPFRNSNLDRTIEIVNYLIADLVGTTKVHNNELQEIFHPFFEFLHGFEKVHIFTLNHDLLLEHLMRLFDHPYSRGFSEDRSPIRAEDTPIPFFNNLFLENTSVQKLHGSIDFFQFRHYRNDGLIYRPTEQVNYYSTSRYGEKHNARLVNPITGEDIQDYNFDIVPKFLTGTKKRDIIKNDIMFSTLFRNYEDIIANTENLLVSGYSFMDFHINELIKNRSFKCVINHNPYLDYPYQTATNIKTLEELLKEEVT